MKQHKLPLVLAVVVLTVAFLDLSNLDRFFHRVLCSALDLVFETNCPDFYDLPIWEVSVSFATLAAVYFAYAAIRQASKQLEVEQTPYLVMKDRISTAGEGRLHTVSLKNIGKGMAINITSTADPEGEISIVEGSNPHSIDLGSGEYNTSWAIDEQRVKEGLEKQGKHIENSVIDEIPDEENLDGANKGNSEFFLYSWYGDQIGHKYMTTTTIRHAGHFLKVMRMRLRGFLSFFSVSCDSNVATVMCATPSLTLFSPSLVLIM